MDMGVEDYQRGERQGYSGMPAGPARNGDEARGRAAGQNQFHADQDMAQRSEAAGYGSAHVPLRYLPLVLGLVLALFLGVRLAVLGLLLAGLWLLTLTPRVRRWLRAATPVYVGAAVGLCMSAVSLIGNSAPLIAENLLMFPALATGAGAVYAVLRWLWQRRSR
jgi:hypothetical protein